MRSIRSLGVLLAAILVLAACSSGSSATTVETSGSGSAEALAFAPTAEFVATSVDWSAAAAHRYEAFVDINASMMGMDLEIAPDEPVMSGVNTGTVASTRADLGLLLTAVFSDLPGGSMFDIEELFGDPDELYVETIVDGDTLYLRAPLISAIGGGAPGMAVEPGLEGLAALGDGWGRIDLSQVDDLDGLDLSGLSGGTMTDITQLFDVLKGSEEITELGDDTVRGTDVSGLRVTTTLGDLIEATGQAEGGGLLPSVGDVDAALESSAAAIDMWVDEAGQIRRLSFALDVPDLGTGEGGFRAGTTIDFFDYGADLSIDIPTDAIDLTAAVGGGITS